MEINHSLLLFSDLPHMHVSAHVARPDKRGFCAEDKTVRSISSRCVSSKWNKFVQISSSFSRLCAAYRAPLFSSRNDSASKLQTPGEWQEKSAKNRKASDGDFLCVCVFMPYVSADASSCSVFLVSRTQATKFPNLSRRNTEWKAFSALLLLSLKIETQFEASDSVVGIFSTQSM